MYAPSGTHKDRLQIHQRAVSRYDMTLCKLFELMLNQHGAGFALSCCLSKTSSKSRPLCIPPSDTTMNSEHGEVKEHAYKSERKEPIKPEPGPDWPLQASAEDICSAHFSKLHWAASDIKISWSLAAVILTTAVHSLGFPLLRNCVRRDKRLWRMAHGVYYDILRPCATVCFNQFIVNMSLLNACFWTNF